MSRAVSKLDPEITIAIRVYRAAEKKWYEHSVIKSRIPRSLAQRLRAMLGKEK